MAESSSQQPAVAREAPQGGEQEGQQQDPDPSDDKAYWIPPFLSVILLYLPVLYAFAQHEEEKTIVPRRVNRRRVHLAPFPDDTCVATYHLDNAAVQELCELLGPQLQSQFRSERCIPVVQRVLMCLHYLAMGSFHGDVARLHRTSQSTATRCVTAVVDALVQHEGEFIVFPETEEERNTTRAQFYAVAGFPDVLGAVGGTHVCISRPSSGASKYLNRHHKMSLNIMATANAKCYFTSVMTDCPGSYHNAQVFRQSRLQEIAADWPAGTGWLLGDRSYPLLPYLLTPYDSDIPGPVARYNAAHRGTRLVVETAFRMLKTRFRCLRLTRGRLMRNPVRAAKIILACMMLHNMCLRRQIPLLEEPGGDPELMPVLAEEEEEPRHHHDLDPSAVQLRNYIATTYFGQESVSGLTDGTPMASGGPPQ